MAQVPDPGAPQSVLPDRIADTTQRVETSPEAFGMGIGTSLQQMGQVFGQASGEAADVMLQRQMQANQIQANSASNQYISGSQKILYGDPNDPSKPGFLTLHGQDAVAAAPGVEKQLDDLRNSISGSLTNPRQQVAFDQDARRYQAMFGASVADHFGKQQAESATAEADAAVTLNHQVGAGNYSTPGAMGMALGKSQDVVRQHGQAMGWGPDQTQVALQSDRDTFFAKAAEAAAGDNPETAQALLVSNRNLMSPAAYAQLTEQLKPKVQQAQADRITQSIIGNPGGAVVGIPGGTSLDGVWTSMKGIESGGRQFGADGQPVSSGVGGADAPVGVAQIKPSTAQGVAAAVGLPYDEARLRNDPAYNEALGKEYLHQMTDRYGGNRTLAVAAYNAGPGQVDQWIKQNGDPRNGQISDSQWAQAIPVSETRNYVARVASENGGSAPAAPGTYQEPDLDGQIALAQQRTAGLPIEVQDRVIAAVERTYHLQMAQTATARSALGEQVKNLNAAYMNGDTTTAIPEQKIRSLLPPDKADETVQALHIEQQAGIAFKGVQWASPDQEQVTRQQLEDPNSLIANRIRLKGKTLTGGGVVQPARYTPGSLPMAQQDGAPDTAAIATDPAGGAAAPVVDTPDNAELRQKVAQRYEAMLNQKHAALAADPAAYVAGHPTVLAAEQAIDPNDPSTFQAYQRASLAVQTQLGVANPRILGNQQVHDIVQKLTTADPSKVDVGNLLDQTAKAYGPMWHQAFGELVTQGKLPADYQTLATMDLPGQAAARAAIHPPLQAGTVEQMKPAATPDYVKQIDGGPGNSALDSDANLVAFKKSTEVGTPGGVALYDTVRSSIQRLAYYYSSQGTNGTTAVANASAAILGQRYDFDGTMRVPKGMLSQVQAATDQVTAGLKPGDLQDIGGMRGLTATDRQSSFIGAAKAGQWMPNADDTGLDLTATLRDGQVRRVLRCCRPPPTR